MKPGKAIAFPYKEISKSSEEIAIPFEGITIASSEIAKPLNEIRIYYIYFWNVQAQIAIQLLLLTPSLTTNSLHFPLKAAICRYGILRVNWSPVNFILISREIHPGQF